MRLKSLLNARNAMLLVAIHLLVAAGNVRAASVDGVPSSAVYSAVDSDAGFLKVADRDTVRACIELLRVIRETERIINTNGDPGNYQRDNLANFKTAFAALNCYEVLSGR